MNADGLIRKDVLIVDDEEPIRTMVARVLSRYNLACDTAPDGLAALDRLETTIYSVMLLDLMMPRLDGIGVVEKLSDRKMPSDERPIVIIMTAYAESADLRVSADIVQAVISKPFDIQELGGLVSDCVAMRRVLQDEQLEISV
ncbi:MAG TPA: response regulator [Thermoanaerobaculia bacterium]|nr:response regulator [Thermoanaerobaculia bacterium]